MRIWSIHPQYLDVKGLVALWRETLLAKKVLEGNTKGYKQHPQLQRFKDSGKAVEYINGYLSAVYEEACSRNYNFDCSKIKLNTLTNVMQVTDGQMQYERMHLLQKLNVRDPERFEKLKLVEKLVPHPMFKVVEGEIEEWEIVNVSRTASPRQCVGGNVH